VAKFNSFAILPPVAMSSSVASMAAQNLGAGLPDRAMKTLIAGIRIVLPLSALFFLVALLAPRAVLDAFQAEPDVVEKGVEYIRYLSIDYLLVPFLFCINGLLTGAGHTAFTMLNSMLSSVILRIPVALLFSTTLGMGMAGIGMAAPAASLGALLVSAIYLKTGRWRHSRIRGWVVEE
jgi:Na+-driven multidrug efflux pump